MCRDTTINGDAQQLVKVYLSDIPLETDKQIYIHGTWLAHSEDLETDRKLEDLTMLHQYVTVPPILETDVLLINNSPAPVVFSKDAIVGHLEQTEIIAHVNEIQHDPLLHAIYSCFKDSDIKPPESRIFAEIDDFQFD